MSHPEQQEFFRAVATANAQLVAGGEVLEIGSYDVNGTFRRTFAGASNYVGVDLKEGPGVDVVGFGHEIGGPDGAYDLAISGECFEHDPHWRATFLNMVRLVRAGGVVAFTCASSGRPEHGTARTLTADSPGTQAVGLDYYRNLTAQDFADLALGDLFTSHAFWYMPTSFDLYFCGVVAGTDPQGRPTGQLPDAEIVKNIRRLMPFSHRAVRAPLRMARAALGDGERYQRAILPYWLGMMRLSERLGVGERS